MSIYLVDYENVHSLCGITNLSESDEVFIFYSSKANTLSFKTHQELMGAKARIHYKEVEVGTQNALDFQLASFLGYLIKENEKEQVQFFIVSKDKGFSHISDFWLKEKSIELKIINNISGKCEETEEKVILAVVDEKQENKKSKQSSLEKELKQSKELSESEIKQVLELVKKYKTVQTINSNLNKMFKDSKKSGAVLKIVKPYIKK